MNVTRETYTVEKFEYNHRYLQEPNVSDRALIKRTTNEETGEQEYKRIFLRGPHSGKPQRLGTDAREEVDRVLDEGKKEYEQPGLEEKLEDEDDGSDDNVEYKYAMTA